MCWKCVYLFTNDLDGFEEFMFFTFFLIDLAEITKNGIAFSGTASVIEL